MAKRKRLYSIPRETASLWVDFGNGMSLKLEGPATRSAEVNVRECLDWLIKAAKAETQKEADRGKAVR